MDACHVDKSFAGVTALRDARLTLLRAQVHGIVGENGSGKSTMVKVLAGFYAADAGTLRVGNDVVNLPWSQSAAMQHGLVFLHQNLGLIPSLSVSENLRLGGASMGPESRPWYLSRQRELEADEALLSAHGIAIDPRIRVASLTPVDRTMVALARALRRLDQLPDGAATKGILCLDEPMAFLPKKERSALTVRLRALAKRGYSIAIVSHNIDELPELAETVTVFRDGATVAEMETRSVSTHDIIDAAIGSTHSVLDRTGGSRGSVGSEQLGAPALEVSDLSGTRLRSFSLAVAQGEIVGVTGLVGSGFEELPYLLCGTASAERGALVIKGRSYQFRDLTASKLATFGVRLVPSDRASAGAVLSLPVSDNMMLPRFSEFFEFLHLRTKKLCIESRRLADTFDVRPRNTSLSAGALSGGNQQKMVLARAISSRPEVLVLHEPTQGVDVGARAQLLDLLRNAAKDGLPVVICSSDSADLVGVCSKVYVVKDGLNEQVLEGFEVTGKAIASASNAR